MYSTNAIPPVRTILFLVALAVVGRASLAEAQVQIGQPPAGGGKALAPPPPRLDLNGDPLPDGAIARLGTTRFRCPATAAAYSADGQLLAVGGGDNQIRLLDARTGREVRRLAGHLPRSYDPARNPKNPFDALVSSVGKGNVTTVAFSPDGKLLASGAWDGAVRIWETATGKEVRALGGHEQGMVAAVRFSPNGRYLASRGGNDGNVILWDVNGFKTLFTQKKVSRVNPWRYNREAPLVFLPDSSALVVGDAKVITFLELPSGKEVRKLEGHLICTSLACSSDGKLFATGGVDGKDKHSLRLWDTATGKEQRRCVLPKDEPPISVAFAPGGKEIAVAVEEDDMHLFEVESGKHLRRLKHYWASRLVFAPDGKALASVGGSLVRLWNPATGDRLPRPEGHEAAVGAVAVSADSKLVATGADDVCLWDTAKATLVRRLAAPGTAVAFTPDGKKLATAARDRTVRLWDVATGKEVSTLTGHKFPIKALAISPDGKYLASGDVQAVIRIWDLAGGKELHAIEMKSSASSLSLVFAPDSKSLACAGAWNDSSFLPGAISFNGLEMTPKKGYLILHWDTATGKELHRFEGLEADLKSVTFSPDGKKVAAAGADGRVCLWDTTTGKDVLYIPAHPGQSDDEFHTTPAVVFSPDSKRLATAGTDRMIRVWDATTAKELATLQGPDGGFCALAFTPDGKKLISGCADTTALIWDLANLKKPSAKEKVIYIRD
jgi:WD40 repeat protein